MYIISQYQCFQMDLLGTVGV